MCLLLLSSKRYGLKILVPTKGIPDTDQRVRIRSDGLGIDTSATSFVMNPFDAIAVEEAVRIREKSETPVEIVAVEVGGEHGQDNLRTALAMGADRALLVSSSEACDPWNVARILCAVVREQQPDLVLMGKQAVDDDANQTGQFMAAQLDWPQATFASRLEFLDRKGVRVWRETDGGLETIVVRLPAVITTDLRLNEPRYASLPSILKAKKKPLDRIDLDDLGVPLEPRVHVLDMEVVSQRRQCDRLESVDELVERLREVAK